MKQKTNPVTVNFCGTPFTGTIIRDTYLKNEVAALLMLNDDGTPYAVLSVNPPTYTDDWSPNHVAIKDYSENEGVLKSLIDAGIVRESGASIPSGWVKLPVCEIIDEELRA